MLHVLFGVQIVTDPMNDDDTSPTIKVPRNRYNEFARLAATETQARKPGWFLPSGGPVRCPTDSRKDFQDRDKYRYICNAFLNYETFIVKTLKALWGAPPPR